MRMGCRSSLHDCNAYAIPFFLFVLSILKLVEHHFSVLIHYGVGEMLDPITEDEDAAAAAQHQVEHDMPVSEDEIVRFVAFTYLSLGKLHQMLLVLTHIVGELVAREAALLAPPVRKAHRDIRMNPAEHLLADLVVEESSHELQHLGIIAKSVTMSEIKLATSTLYLFGTGMQGAADFLRKIVENPDIMVTGEPMDLDSLVGHHGDFAEETCESTRGYMLEFKPKIDDVAQKEELFAVILDGIKEPHYPPLVIQRIVEGAGAKVAVTYEIYLSHDITDAIY